MKVAAHTGPLARLARAYGVQTAYYDITGARKRVSAETLLAVLAALGAPVAGMEDARDALREHEQRRWRRGCEPVVASWAGNAAQVVLRIPQALAGVRVDARLCLETGEELSLAGNVSPASGACEATIEGERYSVRTVGLPDGVPAGYHRFSAVIRGRASQALVVAAPRKAFRPSDGAADAWGVFLPLYALHSRRSIGAGDLSDLGDLMEWIAGLGGKAVGTLPLLAAFLSEPSPPSPYSPASRLFWNEFYLDVARVAEFAACEPAQQMVSSEAFRRETEVLREAPLVDYRRCMALKRPVLEKLSRSFFDGGDPARREAFGAYLAEHPEAERYAAFRATGERRGCQWPAWPAPLRDGAIGPQEYDEEAKRYHLYAQWAFEEQFEAVSRRFREKGVALYLDLPLGANHDSYDVWRYRELFAADAAAGAPPDDFFTQGQDWGFPPLHPVRIREEGFGYFRACVAGQLRHAGILRIDHVMGLHRFFWVPKGMTAREGTYVRYPAEELYAVLCLESHRHRASIVGEDLGTVPSYVRPAMARHGLSRMYVVQFDLSPDPERALDPVPKGSVACLNTHDMPPFASFWEGRDIDDRRERGLLDERESAGEKGRRARAKEALTGFLVRRGWLAGPEPGPREALAGCIAYLAASQADVVMANLEDLVLETRPQNVPGTWKERPNWARKAMASLEEFRAADAVVRILRQLGCLRRGGSAAPGGSPGPGNGEPTREEVG